MGDDGSAPVSVVAAPVAEPAPPAGDPVEGLAAWGMVLSVVGMFASSLSLTTHWAHKPAMAGIGLAALSCLLAVRRRQERAPAVTGIVLGLIGYGSASPVAVDKPIPGETVASLSEDLNATFERSLCDGECFEGDPYYYDLFGPSRWTPLLELTDADEESLCRWSAQIVYQEWPSTGGNLRCNGLFRGYTKWQGCEFRRSASEECAATVGDFKACWPAFLGASERNPCLYLSSTSAEERLVAKLSTIEECASLVPCAGAWVDGFASQGAFTTPERYASRVLP